MITKRQDLCIRFLVFLKNRHDLNKPVDLIFNETGQTAAAKCTRTGATLHVTVTATRRFWDVLFDAAHLYKHCLQRYQERSWIGNGPCPGGSLESEALAFARQEVILFSKTAQPSSTATEQGSNQ
ncbi:hypothetical protein Gbem_2997 [Citrifermentans bemidjiense Bem]|uniref:Uncharacterized protein n=1 Tax=Citrifermentans bemidjiense (strain ATCC BAA-1014 / DSM 16622 / JCM 12645 / Bem) TaxID=404380 RepID=B5E831_CITBB|nr:hypothetical protein [Citrifermentans bemidjiense]ACH40000.1 hypothetical protein Gbem_2997 [Citrifermentans bemidjiense Bem]